ncbi:C-type lectin domain family 2 member B [Pogona vitticeps]
MASKILQIHCNKGEAVKLMDTILKKKKKKKKKMKMMKKKKFICIVLTLIVILPLVLGLVVWQKAKTSPGPSPRSPPPSPSCPSGWSEFKEKCFFTSEAEGGWDRGRQNCTSFNATLATIETREEEDFLKSRNYTDHWIGLWRENDTQPWRRPNGSEFTSSWLLIGGTGECAFWNGVNFTSTRCRAERPWICSKPRSTA